MQYPHLSRHKWVRGIKTLGEYVTLFPKEASRLFAASSSRVDIGAEYSSFMLISIDVGAHPDGLIFALYLRVRCMLGNVLFALVQYHKENV